MTSIYDIVYDYMDLFYSGVPLDKEQKKTIHAEIKKLLVAGWCSSELSSTFKMVKRKSPDLQTLKASTVVKGKRKKEVNLLKQGKFYFHNALRMTSPPPKREIDYDSGEITSISTPYFLEMRASYTVDELVDYYGRQIGTKLRSHEKARYIGSFKWLLKTYDVEMILFMIDATVNMCIAEDMPMPYNPLDIQKYMKEAELAYNQKQTETVVSGGKKIVRKKRVRRNRVRR